MKITLEKLWNDYLLEQCSAMDTDEERELTKKAVKLHGEVTDLLTAEQQCSVEAYVDALCEINTLFAKKAFLKGCEFAVSFLLEARNSENQK